MPKAYRLHAKPPRAMHSPDVQFRHRRDSQVKEVGAMTSWKRVKNELLCVFLLKTGESFNLSALF